MEKLLIDYGNRYKILNKAIDVRQDWQEIQEKLNQAMNELEGYGSIAPDTVVLISEMSDEIANIENNKAVLQGFIASFSQYLDHAREVEEDLKLYINESEGYTVVISSQIEEKEGLATRKFVIGGLIIIGSIALAIACPATSPILAKILTGMAVGSASGGIIGGGLTAAFGGDYCDIADGFLAGTVTGAIEGGLSLGTGYKGFAKYVLKDLAIGTTADFGYGMIDSAIEGNPDGVLMGGVNEAFNPINMVTNLGTGMFGAGVGSGKIKIKMPQGLKVPDSIKEPFRRGKESVNTLYRNIQEKASRRIGDVLDSINIKRNKDFTSIIRRNNPELYLKLQWDEFKRATSDNVVYQFPTVPAMDLKGRLKHLEKAVPGSKFIYNNLNKTKYFDNVKFEKLLLDNNEEGVSNYIKVFKNDILEDFKIINKSYNSNASDDVINRIFDLGKNNESLENFIFDIVKNKSEYGYKSRFKGVYDAVKYLDANPKVGLTSEEYIKDLFEILNEKSRYNYKIGVSTNKGRSVSNLIELLNPENKYLREWTKDILNSDIDVNKNISRLLELKKTFNQVSLDNKESLKALDNMSNLYGKDKVRNILDSIGTGQLEKYLYEVKLNPEAGTNKLKGLFDYDELIKNSNIDKNIDENLRVLWNSSNKNDKYFKSLIFDVVNNGGSSDEINKEIGRLLQSKTLIDDYLSGTKSIDLSKVDKGFTNNKMQFKEIWDEMLTNKETDKINALIYNLGKYDTVADMDKFMLEVVRYENGSHFTRGEKGLKVLKPNNTYTSSYGYKYNTDELGRVIAVEADDLILATGRRNSDAQLKAGRPDRGSADNGGHLIASMFGGSGDLDNLVAMLDKINKSSGVKGQGQWFKMEQKWREGLMKNNNVSVILDISYPDRSMRPDIFEGEYVIGGGNFEKIKIQNN